MFLHDGHAKCMFSSLQDKTKVSAMRLCTAGPEIPGSWVDVTGYLRSFTSCLHLAWHTHAVDSGMCKLDALLTCWGKQVSMAACTVRAPGFIFITAIFVSVAFTNIACNTLACCCACVYPCAVPNHHPTPHLYCLVLMSQKYQEDY